MTRIEIGEQGVLLDVKNSTILVLPGPKKSAQPIHKVPEMQIQEVVGSEILRRAVQDHLDLGSDDIDQEAGLSRLENQLRLARHVFTFEDFQGLVDKVTSEMSRDLEGSRIGSVSTRLRSATDFIKRRAEEIWTDPK